MTREATTRSLPTAVKSNPCSLPLEKAQCSQNKQKFLSDEPTCDTQEMLHSTELPLLPLLRVSRPQPLSPCTPHTSLDTFLNGIHRSRGQA